MSQRESTESPPVVPDMPPSRPTTPLLLGAVVLVLAVVALMHEHQLVTFLQTELFG